MSLFETGERFDIRGVAVLRGTLDRSGQGGLLGDLRALAGIAPFFHPETRGGQKMSVRMTSAGTVGWISGRKGYRYASRHPAGGDWPAIPPRLLDLWRTLLPGASMPDTCLVNYYGEGARMGLHQDRDEADLSQPVLSLSLGDEALFRVGSLERAGGQKASGCGPVMSRSLMARRGWPITASTASDSARPIFCPRAVGST